MSFLDEYAEVQARLDTEREKDRTDWNAKYPPTIEVEREDGETIGIWSQSGEACQWAVKRGDKGYNPYHLHQIPPEVFQAIRERKLDV